MKEDSYKDIARLRNGVKTGESRTVLQYPTYYAGCCLWGSIDLSLGKERLFEALASYDGFMEAWEEARQVLCSEQEKEGKTT